MWATASRTWPRKVVGDHLLDEHARAGKADLARVDVLARDGLRRGLQVGVGADDERRLAAELHADRA